jgi:hypothetical protein
VVLIDGWLRLSAAAQTAVLFKQLRMTLDAVLKELTRKPEVYSLLVVHAKVKQKTRFFSNTTNEKTSADELDISYSSSVSCPSIHIWFTT